MYTHLKYNFLLSTQSCISNIFHAFYRPSKFCANEGFLRYNSVTKLFSMGTKMWLVCFYWSSYELLMLLFYQNTSLLLQYWFNTIMRLRFSYYWYIFHVTSLPKDCIKTFIADKIYNNQLFLIFCYLGHSTLSNVFLFHLESLSC